MSENIKLEKLKNKYIKDNELNFKRVYLSEEENIKVTEEYKRTSVADIPDKFKEYGFDYESDLNKFTFYKKEPCEVNENELNQYMLLQLNEKLDITYKKISTIENMVIFVLIIIGIPLIMLILGSM